MSVVSTVEQIIEYFLFRVKEGDFEYIFMTKKNDMLMNSVENKNCLRH